MSSFLDVMMPMVDGYATLEQIRKDTNLQHTKVMSWKSHMTLIDWLEAAAL